MADINCLPREVLLRIFSFYLETESQLVFIRNIAKVSELWEDLCQDISLWKKFDGTLSFKYLLNLIKEKRLRNAKTLVISHSRIAPNSKTLQEIYEGVPNVRYINFSYITIKMTRIITAISELETKCPHLRKIVFNDIHLEMKAKFSYLLFESFFELRGRALVSLDFSNLDIYDADKLLKLLARSCPNLEELLFLNLSTERPSAKFPIERMQNGCPKLKVLRLGPPLILSDLIKPSPGFTELEVFTYCADLNNFFNSSQLQRLLSKSSQLKVLDVRGSTLLKGRSLSELPAAYLEELYLSRSRICLNKQGLLILLHKWARTLKALDISRMPGGFINEIFELLLSNNNLPQLESLDLNNTAVRKSTIKLIVGKCERLNYLQLESCRQLKRGHRRAYRGRKDIEELISNFDQESISNC